MLRMLTRATSVGWLARPQPRPEPCGGPCGGSRRRLGMKRGLVRSMPLVPYHHPALPLTHPRAAGSPPSCWPAMIQVDACCACCAPASRPVAPALHRLAPLAAQQNACRAAGGPAACSAAGQAAKPAPFPAQPPQHTDQTVPLVSHVPRPWHDMTWHGMASDPSATHATSLQRAKSCSRCAG